MVNKIDENIDLMIERANKSQCVLCGIDLIIEGGLIHGCSTIVGYTCCDSEDFAEDTWQQEVLDGWWK